MNRARNIRNSILLATALVLPFAAAWAISPEDIIEHVQDKYQDVTDATITYTQSVKFRVSQAEQTSDGTLYFKKKNQYRIETGDRTVVTDGVTSWSYNPKANQVIIDKYKEDAHSMAPDKLLLSFPENQFASVLPNQTVGGEDCYVLKLTPKDENSFTTGMKIWITSDWLIKQVQVTDINQAVTTYTIKSIKLNTGLKEGTFKFKAPEKADVIDLR